MYLTETFSENFLKTDSHIATGSYRDLTCLLSLITASTRGMLLKKKFPVFMYMRISSSA